MPRSIVQKAKNICRYLGSRLNGTLIMLLYDNNDFRIFCALELDDDSHNRSDRKKRDKIINQACEVSGIRLERLKVTIKRKRLN